MRKSVRNDTATKARTRNDDLEAGEKFKALQDDFFHILDGIGEEFIRRNFARFFGERSLQPAAPGEADFGADVNNGHAVLRGRDKLFILQAVVACFRDIYRDDRCSRSSSFRVSYATFA